ncbi:MAG TPA: hypothetical protein VM165_16130 [Planctomycetaceae bacterium]|nr:hypothetical protein [Planctomycetaceae bacterium]
MSRQRTLLPTLMVWAMLPLTVLSGSPRSACLCSNGDLKLFCQAAQSNRSCCANSGSVAHSPQDGASAKSACCRGSGGPPHSSSACTVAGCRCTPVIVLPDVPPKAETATAPDFEGAVNHINDDVLSAFPLPRSHGISFYPAPPEEGRDLVILLSRMLA